MANKILGRQHSCDKPKILIQTWANEFCCRLGLKSLFQVKSFSKPNKKRKRPQQQQLTLKKNKKPRINNWVWDDDDDDDHSICLHLMLGSSSCIPTCVHQTNNNIIVAAADDDHQWVIKKVLEKNDVCLHLCRLLLNKEVAQKFIIPFLLGGAEAAQTKQGIQDSSSSPRHRHQLLLCTFAYLSCVVLAPMMSTVDCGKS
ncbi:B3 domain-containing protein [Trifolium pratense]|uniref:B3 domain-containing protein n=1 Tax=Trifolium pratense TaxID=57577 RepID=A0A2K3NVB4_TRIPR|nr:B3 domain-containing protein [Trifolium pratense]